MAASNVQSKKKLFEKLIGVPIRQKIVPARSQVAVNKSLSKIANKSRTTTAEQAQTINDVKAEEIFVENFEMVIALLPTVPFILSKHIRKWVAVLLDSASGLSLQRRNNYLSFLIFQMQNMNITDPFDKEPPQNLSEATRLFNAAKLKAMISEMDKKHRRNILREGLTPHALSSFRTNFKTPPEFFDDQVFPNNGIVCYGGCFSNYFQ